MKVTEAWYYICKGKAPKWALIVIYMIFAPIGYALLPIAIIVSKCLIYRLKRKLNKEFEEEV